MRTQLTLLKPAPSSERPTRSGLIQRKCACGGVAGPTGECEACSKKRSPLQRRTLASATGDQSSAAVPSSVHQVLRGPGRPLDASTRAFMELRLGHEFTGIQNHAPRSGSPPAALSLGMPNEPAEKDAEAVAESVTRSSPTASAERFDLSHVRVHTDARAAASARDVNAHAYTVGHNMVFGAGQYAPNTASGLRLLAHELTHVAQQRALAQPMRVQREGMGDLRVAEACHQLEADIRRTPAYMALPPDTLRLAQEIIAEIRNRKLLDRYQFFVKLKQLFDTPLKSAATVTAETQARTTTATEDEKSRLAKQAKLRGIEEAASADKKRHWTPVKGKFGDGTYYVDKTSSTSIVVRADLYLTPAGSGTQQDVDAIKAMEDGIEKAASTKGYLVDIRFVNAPAADTFKADVDPSKPRVATNWSGGSARGFAHELHHMFAFELDRYDYTSHATNESMAIPDRLHWFREELKKPADYNDPTSIMSSAAHPNDDDACRVAGLDVVTCVPARAAARAAGKL